MHTVLALALSLFSLSAHSAPIVLTFEDVTVGGMSPDPETIIYRGYSLTTELGFESTFTSPEPSLQFCNGCSVTVREENDNPFSLGSFDIYDVGGEMTLTVTGGYAGGGTVSEVLVFTFPYAGGWEGVSLVGQWTNLEYVNLDVYVNDGFF